MTAIRPSRAAATAAAMALVLAGAYAGIAQEPKPQPGAAQRVGRKLDEIFKGVSREVRAQFTAARTEVDDLKVESRVYSRLHWDKALTDHDLGVESREGGIVVLYGTVPDPAAQSRAVELARGTVGVDQVVDKLVVIAPAGPGVDAKPIK